MKKLERSLYCSTLTIIRNRTLVNMTKNLEKKNRSIICVGRVNTSEQIISLEFDLKKRQANKNTFKLRVLT